MEEHNHLFLWATLLVVFVLILEVIKRKSIKQESSSKSAADNQNSFNSVCESNDCVRCFKNKDILTNALTRLTFYSGSDASVEVNGSVNSPTANDIRFVCKDINSSIAVLKKKDFENSSFSAQTKTSSPVVFKISGVREQKLWPLDDFPALNILENNASQIYLELTHLYRSPLSETVCLWKKNYATGGLWEIAMLIDQGKTTKAADLCPITMDVINQIPYLMKKNMFGNAAFSVIHPGTEIAPHCGPTNCRIRCHLGLQVPDGCELHVGQESVKWDAGKVLLFNDAFEHSVTFKDVAGVKPRMVLMIDLWHPDINESQKTLLDYAFS